MMPDQGSTRYDERDWPGFQRALADLCPDCTPIYLNGLADVALQPRLVFNGPDHGRAANVKNMACPCANPGGSDNAANLLRQVVSFPVPGG